jgi:uncharacterized membrane protein YhhN
MHKGTAPKLTLALFAAVLAADLVFTWADLQTLRLISKPLIVLSLLAYFLLSTKEASSPLKSWVVGALVFSWLGDVLLLFEARDSLFFILGLSAFLLAHVAYIVFFNRLRRVEGIGLQPFLFLPVLVYYIGLISLLYPSLGGMKLPVVVYGAVISTMLAAALHLKAIRGSRAGALFVLGAALFVLSDSLLAVNKFLQPFAGAGLLIMLTYGLAQFFIVRGSILVVQMGKAPGSVVGPKEELYNDSFID